MKLILKGALILSQHDKELSILMRDEERGTAPLTWLLGTELDVEWRESLVEGQIGKVEHVTITVEQDDGAVRDSPSGVGGTRKDLGCD